MTLCSRRYGSDRWLLILRQVNVPKGSIEPLAFLRREGCDEVQGYDFGKPMPVRDFERI